MSRIQATLGQVVVTTKLSESNTAASWGTTTAPRF